MLSIFLLSLVTINSEHVKNGEKWFKSKIFIGADDYLVSLTLNDNEVNIPILLNNWLAVQTLDLVLFPGDELVFTLKNNAENFSTSDPGAFAARIEYVNQNIRLILLTGLVMVENRKLMEMFLNFKIFKLAITKFR